MTHTNTEKPSLAAVIHDLRESHARTSPGTWGKGATTHETVSRSEGREPYKVAEFRHANDAQFCDLAHAFVPNLLSEIEALQSRVQELEAEATNNAKQASLTDGQITQTLWNENLHVLRERGVDTEGMQPYGNWLDGVDSLCPSHRTRPRHQTGEAAMTQNIDQERAEFEAWWQSDGQFCRAGGGDYEKTFAYHAWRKATSEFRCLDCEDTGVNTGTGYDCSYCLGDLQAARRAPVVPHTKVKPDFYWDSEKQHHVPTLLIEFEPVPAGEPCYAKGWTDRDNLAAMLAAAPQP